MHYIYVSSTMVIALLCSLLLVSCPREDIKQPSESIESAPQQHTATAKEVIKYETQISQARLVRAQILKGASQLFQEGKISDSQIGSIRSMGRTVDLEIEIASSSLELYKLNRLSTSHLEESLRSLSASINKFQALWARYR